MSVLTEIISRAEKGSATIRDGWVILDRLQAEVDYLKELEETLPASDMSVTVKINGTSIRFQNTDKFAEWLTGGKHG